MTIPDMESSVAPPTTSSEPTPTPTPKTAVVKRRRRRKNPTTGPVLPSVLTDLNPDLVKAIATCLPTEYEFEIFKCLERIHTLALGRSPPQEASTAVAPENDVTGWKVEEERVHVSLQMPEGLLLYATTIADLLKRFSVCRVEQVSILGDVTYGACCIDDLGAQALGVDLLIHYGHSCLVPLTHTVVPCLYVFCQIHIRVSHLLDCVIQTLTSPKTTHIHVMGTVQFRSAVVEAAQGLNERGYTATIPQAKPLSPGEVLGCTAPAGLAALTPLAGDDDDKTTSKSAVMLFVADGRFHLEAAMIANPTIPALRYDPYSKTLTRESYETAKMHTLRQQAIAQASSAKCFGIILGTLGRQGNPAILHTVRTLLKQHSKRCIVVLLSEVFPRKLDLFSQHVDAWVQIACPRLSVDWGHFFRQPVLSPYELHVCLGTTPFRDVYPMDFYTLDSTGPWSNYHPTNRSRTMTKAT